MSWPALAFDTLLAATLTFLAWRLLFGRELFTSVVLFIAFGLAMALAWARLEAIDIALAEAAIGAGLTGALLLGAEGQMAGTSLAGPSSRVRPPVALLCIALGLALLALLRAFSWPRVGLVDEVAANAAALELTQPVTAVLLVFRGYDTWLELAVLLIAALAVLGLMDRQNGSGRKGSPLAGPLLPAFARFLVPIALTAAGYVVWLGSRNPGGAFQGGAVAAAALVLAYLAGVRTFGLLHELRSRLLLAAAFTLPLLLTLPALIAGEPMLSYPQGRPGGWLWLIEAAVAASVTFTLASLFVAAEPQERTGVENPPGAAGDDASTPRDETGDSATLRASGTSADGADE